MPMKKIHVEFELDPEVFMKMLQHGSSSMKIAVFGDDKGHKLPKKEKEPKLLAAPKNDRVGSKKIVMDYAKLHKDMGFKPKELQPIVTAAGYSNNTHSPVLMWLMSRGYLRRDKEGTYYPTAKGMTYGEE
jgi:hypothetical protein